MVLLFSSAVCNVTMRIRDRMHMCWKFCVFCSKQSVIFFRFWPRLLLVFACTDSYYVYKMAKCIQNVLEVQFCKLCSFNATACPISSVDYKIAEIGPFTLLFVIWLSKPHVKRNQTYSLVALFHRIRHSYDIISHNVCILCRDFYPYISGSHKRTRSQCKKVYIFPIFDEKIPNMRGKFPKPDKVSLSWILLNSQKCVFCEFFLLQQSLHMLNKYKPTVIWASTYQNKHLTKRWQFPIWSNMLLFFPKGQVPDLFPKGSEKSLLCSHCWNLLYVFTRPQKRSNL